MTSGARYATTLIVILAACTVIGLAAGRYLPNPLAVMALIGAVTAAATAPFIVPIDHPEEDP